MIADDQGRKDESEWFTVSTYLPNHRPAQSSTFAHDSQISRDDILSSDDYLPTARILNKNRYLLQSYVRFCHAILTIILNSLNNSLGLPPSTLANLHRLSARSGDVVRFILNEPHNAEEASSAPAFGTHRERRHAHASLQPAR
jgi:hypothetical protein